MAIRGAVKSQSTHPPLPETQLQVATATKKAALWLMPERRFPRTMMCCGALSHPLCLPPTPPPASLSTYAPDGKGGLDEALQAVVLLLFAEVITLHGNRWPAHRACFVGRQQESPDQALGKGRLFPPASASITCTGGESGFFPRQASEFRRSLAASREPYMPVVASSQPLPSAWEVGSAMLSAAELWVTKGYFVPRGRS